MFNSDNNSGSQPFYGCWHNTIQNNWKKPPKSSKILETTRFVMLCLVMNDVWRHFETYLVVLTVMTAWTCSRKLTSVSVPAQEVVSIVKNKVLSAGISLKKISNKGRLRINFYLLRIFRSKLSFEKTFLISNFV